MAIRNAGDQLLAACRKPFTRRLLANLGLPTPLDLQRGDAVFRPNIIEGYSARVTSMNDMPWTANLKSLLSATTRMPPSYPSPAKTPQRVVFDSTHLEYSDMPKFAIDVVKPVISALTPNSRLVFLTANRPGATMTTAGINSFVRSLAKEVGAKGSTVNHIQLNEPCIDADVPPSLIGPLSFLLSPESCFVSGQTVLVDNTAKLPASTGLKQKVALITGGERGIGAAIAARYAKEGARVLIVDRFDGVSSPSTAVKAQLGDTSSALALDITSSNAAEMLQRFIRSEVEDGQIDVVVHNAGITRDKTLKNMSMQMYQQVMDVNLNAIHRINERFGISLPSSVATSASAPTLREGGRVIMLSSINGIAGAAGQTNYAFTKGALIGYAADLAAAQRHRSVTVNAVAPGFIETAMVAKMPWMIRNVGRRSNALGQGGLPEDVAAVVAFLALPEAQGISGQVLRVCGCNMVGR